jgi:gamma-glutamylcyclotransferase (GGCT)/AIG2-like uncharacterized protein YtfP
MKTKIFCYGTLQEPNVQMELIGRTVLGELVSIDGYVILRDYVDPQDGIAYPRIVPMKNGCVYGRILEFTDDEIKILNDYETDMYILEKIIINDEAVYTYVENPNYQA